MAQTAEFYDNLSAQLITGVVMDDGAPEDGPDAVFHARSGNMTFDARLAASCLMRPERGDSVLLAQLEDGANVILSILDRADAASLCRLRLPQDSSLECPGRLSVTTADTLDLQSGRSMGLRTDALSLSAMNADMQVTRMKAVMHKLDACCHSLYVLGDAARCVMRSLTQCLGSSRRMIEGEDETRAGSSTLMVTENATLMAKNGLTLVEDTARTDAKLIQLG